MVYYGIFWSGQLRDPGVSTWATCGTFDENSFLSYFQK